MPGYRGNLTDVSLVAAVAALKHLRLPSVAVSGTGDEASVRVLPVDQAERQPLIFHHTPVAVSLSFLQAAEGGPISYVVDPTEVEEAVAVSSLSVVVNQHQELCALEKPGGVPVDDGQLLECVQRAAALAPQRLLVLDEVLAKHALQLAEAAETLRRTGRVAAAPASAAENDGLAIAAVGMHPAAELAGQPPLEVSPTKDASTTKGVAARKRSRDAALDNDEEETTGTVRSAFER